MSTLLVETAVRSIVLAALVASALKLLRVRQVRAQRAAWLLVLVAAAAMPIVVDMQLGPHLWTVVANQPPDMTGRGELSDTGASVPPRRELTSTSSRQQPAPGAKAVAAKAVAAWWREFSGMVYLIVVAVLAGRLATGLYLAFQLRRGAPPVTLDDHAGTDYRVSPLVKSPLTVGSTVLLPITYSQWHRETLRVVLLHERAHVKQRDFYWQLLASLYCTVFWFSPFSWWLKRRLADLGEALSDHAASAGASSRASYAEVLLAFAAPADWLPAGVAMSRVSNLAPRIERLIDEANFAQSFAAKRVPRYLAYAVVVSALLASTAVIRVHAEPPAPQSDDDAENDIMAIHTGDSHISFNEGDVKASSSRLRKMDPNLGGDYILYQYQGKQYLIKDPAILSQAKALLAPSEALRRKQRELGLAQGKLGLQQRALAEQQHAVKGHATDFQREIAELDKLVQRTKLAGTAPQVTPEALGELQSKLGEIQTRIGEMQLEAGLQRGQLGELQGALGADQGKLGEDEYRLAEQQRKVIEDAMRQLKPMIRKAVEDGRGQSLP